ncbi:MAG TPA: hypothetical protein VGI70_18650, partial [Polyangiales bacterium]
LPLGFVALRIARGAAADGGIGLSLFDAYAFACALRLLAEVVARTYHAGVFALRRVYRPLVSLLLADLLEVALIVSCFDALGPWSIPLSIVLGGAIDGGFTLHYARAAYLRHRMLLPRWRAALRVRLRPPLPAIERALAYALAGASLQLDAWLLLLLIRVDPPRRAAPSLALLYYVLRPLLSLATHWVRTFYFDLVHLDAGGLRAFRPHLLRLLRRLAIAAALFGSVLTLMAARSLWPEFALARLIGFVPFFAARSLFALAQLRAFARGLIRRLVWTSLALATGSSLLALGRNGSLLLSGVALLLALGALSLRESSAGPIARADRRVLGIAEWLRALRASHRVRIAVLRVARSSADVGRVLETLANSRPELVLTRHARAHLLLMAAGDTLPSSEALVALSAGALDRIWLSPPCRGGDSVTIAQAEHALPNELTRALDPNARDQGFELLQSEFARTFSNGQLLDLGAGIGSLDERCCPKSLLGEFVQQLTAASHQRERDTRARLPCELAVYAPGGQAQLVFVVPRGTRGFAPFRARVREATLHASFYSCATSAP